MPGALDDKNAPPPGETEEQKVAREAAIAEAAAAEAAKANPDAELLKLTPEELAAEVKKLRKENADRRTKNKALDEQKKAADDVMGKLKQALGIEDDKESPEEKAKSLQAQNDALQMELGILQIGNQHQVPADQMEFFAFLFNKAVAGLGEGEELDEAGLEELVSKAKAAGGAGSKPNSSGINGAGGGSPPPGGKPGAITLDQFVQMNPGERGGLFTKNPTLYNSLFTEAKSKRLL